MKEKWKSILNSNYSISSKGRVKNNKTNRILKTFITNDGFCKRNKIKLPLQGTRKTYIVSRLVAEAFIPNPENKAEVDHKNRDSLNDDMDNLRWATRKENCKNRLILSKNIIDKILELDKKGKNSNEIYSILKNIK